MMSSITTTCVRKYMLKFKFHQLHPNGRNSNFSVYFRTLVVVMDDIMWWRLINSSIYVFVKCSARFGKKLPQRMRNGSILKKNWCFIFAFDFILQNLQCFVCVEDHTKHGIVIIDMILHLSAQELLTMRHHSGSSKENVHAEHIRTHIQFV